MYCPKCGSKVNEGANFCSICGASIQQVQVDTTSSPVYSYKGNNSATPLLVLKPRFIPVVTILTVLPLQIFFTLWGGGFFGGFGMFAIQALDLNLPNWLPFVAFASLFFFAIPILTFTFSSKTYDRTEFRFYPDKLDYYEGFFTVEEKTISYRNVTEVNLRRNIFQRKYGLGTIILSTPATGYVRGRARSGILIFDIENPEKHYAEIKRLVEKARTTTPVYA